MKPLQKCEGFLCQLSNDNLYKFIDEWVENQRNK